MTSAIATTISLSALNLSDKKLGLSQEELAQKPGVSFTSVNRWENGQTKPSKLARRQIEALCKKLNCQMPMFGRKD